MNYCYRSLNEELSVLDMEEFLTSGAGGLIRSFISYINNQRFPDYAPRLTEAGWRCCENDPACENPSYQVFEVKYIYLVRLSMAGELRGRGKARCRGGGRADR